MLTTAAAKAAGAQPRAYKLFDAGGLFLFVAPTGCKSWRLKYRWKGREKLLTIGRFPEVSLPIARARREEAKEQLRANVDPGAVHTNVDRTVGTFEPLARAWYRHNRTSWSMAHAADVKASLERDVFPAIGREPVASIEPPALLQVLRRVESRGRIETARRLRQRLSEIFAYGIAEGLAARDPAASLGAALREVPPARPQPALTTVNGCRDLLAACDRVDALASIRLASRFLALTAVRLDAIRGMLWGELENLLGEAPIWIVPPARMKLKQAKKGEARFAHVVPLSAAAVAVLREAASFQIGRQLTNEPFVDISPGALVFPGRDGSTPIGEGALRDLYARAGFAGRHVPHGWRSSFSTILNELLGDAWARDIDRALAHSPKDKVEAAYNRAQLLERRRELFDTWGALLTG